MDIETIKNHRKDFEHRWGIQVVDADNEFIKLKKRVLTILHPTGIHRRKNDPRMYVDHDVRESSHEDFCIIRGCAPAYQEAPPSIDCSPSLRTIEHEVERTDTIESLIECLEHIFMLKFKTYQKIAPDSDCSKTKFLTIDSKAEYMRLIKDAIDLSKIDIRCEINADNKIPLIIYPDGEEKLDNDLVASALSFLDSKSNKHFAEALEQYKKKKHVQSAESLRRTLEEWLRFKFSNTAVDNTAGLKTNIKKLRGILKEFHKNEQANEKSDSKGNVREIIGQIFYHIDQYFNINSKHDSRIYAEAENEFLIYQIALLCRYVDRTLSTEK